MGNGVSPGYYPEGSEVPCLEAEIDGLVFDLYGLADDERGLVLSSTGSVRSRRGTNG